MLAVDIIFVRQNLTTKEEDFSHETGINVDAVTSNRHVFTDSI